VIEVSHVLVVIAILNVGIIYGTDLFSLIVLRPALARVDDQTLVAIMGRVHQFADRRLRLPGIAGLAFTVAGAAFVAGVDRLGATIAGIVGVIASVMWLVIYSRISAPINARLTAATLSGETPLDTRLLQQRWDGVITARSALQLLTLLSLCLLLIAS
jgi:hypothetical protein